MAHVRFQPFCSVLQLIDPVCPLRFLGDGTFCAKFCDLNAPNAQGICQHIYDEAGCNVNVPAAYRDGVFESCEGDDQAPVQPGVTAIPKSYNCIQYKSSDLYPNSVSPVCKLVLVTRN